MPIDAKKFKSRAWLAAAIIFATASIATVIYYIIWPSEGFFHSDCADTLYWAQASYDAKALFNKDFGYAATLPFGGAAIMAPFIGLFGVSTTTQHIGMVIFTLLLFASVWLLCRSLRFSRALSLSTVGIMAMALCSSEKLREIFYEHVIYYSISVLIICVLLSLLIKFRESFEKDILTKRVLFIVAALMIFSICCALDGVQVIATAVLPVLFAAVVAMFFDNQKLFSKSGKISFLFCLICFFATLLGLYLFSVLSEGVSIGYERAYSQYANMEDWLGNLGKFPLHWFWLFGVDAAYGMSIFSPESIINIIRIAAAIIIAGVPFIALILYKRFDYPSKLLILTHFGMSAVIMFGYVFGILSSANWRLSPMICTGIIVTIATLRLATKHIVAKRFAALAACILVLMSAVSFMNIAKMDKNGIENNQKYQLAMVLKEKGLTYGFATFWNSQAITVLSDSEVRVANTDINESGIAPCPFQTNRSWFEPQEGIDKYFVLTSDAELETLQNTEDWTLFEMLTKEIINLDGYKIFVFDSLFFLD